MSNFLNLSKIESDSIVNYIVKKFVKLDGARAAQLDDIAALRSAIYDTGSKNKNRQGFSLPDVWELAQTLKSHLMENLYSNPEAMFDVAGATYEAQAGANAQKAMLVSYFEKMNLSAEVEKIVDSVVETGEATVLVGWDTKTRTIRRAQTLEEQVFAPSEDGFVVEQRVIFDGPTVKFIPAQDFVYDVERGANFASAAKICRTYATLGEIRANKLNNLLTDEKIAELEAMLGEGSAVPDLLGEPTKAGVKGEQLELLEYWGDIVVNGKTFENMLVVVAGRYHVIRIEQNPFLTQPFVHSAVVCDPRTMRGVSPLKIALGLTDVASTILNKQLDALSLIINPPYLAPKGCFKGEQIVTPGKIIEYDAALMPNQPIPLNFASALRGWDFINFFKTSIESATGIYKTMVGNLAPSGRTATEINYSASGQSARLNMIIDSISRKMLVPIVEKTAEVLANFKIGDELIPVYVAGNTQFITVSDVIRKNDYIYRYGDRRASIERKYRFKELFEIVAQFAQRPDFAKNIDFVECFKFALEQYGVENPQHFLLGADNNAQNPAATSLYAQSPAQSPHATGVQPLNTNVVTASSLAFNDVGADISPESFAA